MCHVIWNGVGFHTMWCMWVFLLPCTRCNACSAHVSGMPWTIKPLFFACITPYHFKTINNWNECYLIWIHKIVSVICPLCAMIESKVNTHSKLRKRGKLMNGNINAISAITRQYVHLSLEVPIPFGNETVKIWKIYVMCSTCALLQRRIRVLCGPFNTWYITASALH